MKWLQEKNLFVGDLENLNSFSFASLFQTVAGYVNYLLGFALVVFLFLAFGLAEMDDFKAKLLALDNKMSGWSLLETSGRIAEKIRKYMLIRTLASVATGVAVFLFTLAVGLELAVAWGILAFVLNYIPYVGPLIAVILPVIFATAQFKSWQMAVFIFGSLYLIQFVIGSYLEPILTGNALAISPFVMLLAFLIWDFLWGMPGAFIGLPVTIALFTIWQQNPSNTLDRGPHVNFRRCVRSPLENPAKSAASPADVAPRLYTRAAIDTGDKRTLLFLINVRLLPMPP